MGCSCTLKSPAIIMVANGLLIFNQYSHSAICFILHLSRQDDKYTLATYISKFSWTIWTTSSSSSQRLSGRVLAMFRLVKFLWIPMLIPPPLALFSLFLLMQLQEVEFTIAYLVSCKQMMCGWWALMVSQVSGFIDETFH